jgi:CheY-like chemotaxis protein
MYRILVVEDEPEWQQRMSEAFKGMGYSVSLADTFEKAVDLIDGEIPFDLVTVDMNLTKGGSVDATKTPLDRISGLYVLDYLAKHHRGEMCILFSGEKLEVEHFNKFNDFQSIFAGAFNKRDGSRDLLSRVREVMRTRRKRMFVSYRRQDSFDITGRICDRLISHFGQGRVFYDQDSIPVGVDFRQHIRQNIQACDAMLVVIGTNWTTATKESSGQSRLSDPADFVRIEILEAIQHQIPLIPLLVQGVTMPQADLLPPELQVVVYQQGVEIESGMGFHDSVDRLIAKLEALPA